MINDKHGFTLVELLAVIVVLAIVMLVAVQSVLPQMEKARRQTLALDAQTAIEAANTYFMNLSLSTGKGFPSANNGKNCVDINTLINTGYFSVKGDYYGKVVVEKSSNNYLYTVYLRKDQLMINGKGVKTENSVKKNVQIVATDGTDSDVVPYDATAWGTGNACQSGEILN